MRVLLDPNPTTFAAAAVASDRWNKLARIEEKFFRQKSCIRWLGAGDQNTVVFHRAVQTRTSRNTIKRLVNEAGETLTKLSDIKKEAVQHFQRFLQQGKVIEVTGKSVYAILALLVRLGSVMLLHKLAGTLGGIELSYL
ncbi:hypothetical protein HID58_028400 [Brassica napus]|uniref:Uncharacterized protein n=1 Tax=Brassica napus TaxID=3708 RepID=A0ABQ8CA36_BRANA|nr:hypothetical protein HID58_028400 [Brassica napus]